MIKVPRSKTAKILLPLSASQNSHHEEPSNYSHLQQTIGPCAILLPIYPSVKLHLINGSSSRRVFLRSWKRGEPPLCTRPRTHERVVPGVSSVPITNEGCLRGQAGPGKRGWVARYWTKGEGGEQRSSYWLELRQFSVPGDVISLLQPPRGNSEDAAAGGEGLIDLAARGRCFAPD